ncbi:MAG: hypothetical protein LVQ97_01045 [Candidatus Micrarchaeales archaeon]|jgi:hypothetical protein|uniref:Uncharacterized protein n=1 Tax=Candidatus Micrarchaeum acidiphilum ARMAN-2 TaxID=425595 RepID=C7DHT5_MICA2|nr:MAG: hypothetical protein UNLARM2_0626 [Candidatus Micrarchaeum acidiphilum ARMAN-2]MCW6160756.1 hypothetical protein [Candidatus Micrarchaeales archaeon]
MMVHIISENPATGIAISNMLNTYGTHSTISEDTEISTERELLEVKNSLGRADKLIIVASNPLELMIKSNKLGETAAAVCKDREDAEAASSSGVDILIFDVRMPKSIIVDNVSTFLGLAGKPAQQPAQKKGPKLQQAQKYPAPQRPKLQPQPQAKDGEENAGRFGSILSIVQLKKGAAKHQEQEEEEDRKGPPPKGISGKIKNIFGIMD